MNDEERIDRTMKDFYMDDSGGTHDRDSMLREVLDTVHVTPQEHRRKWWPFGRHQVDASASPDVVLEADPRPVQEGHTGSRKTATSVRLVGFAAVSVIAAVFGAFVLFGPLSTDQGDGRPGAVNSPSASGIPASPDAEATTDADATPAPVDPREAAIDTALAELEPTFVAEQVEPGIERIISDGADLDMSALPETVLYAFSDIAAGPNGEIWVVAHRYHTDTGRVEGPFALELGTPGESGSTQGFPRAPTKLVVSADGIPVVAAPEGIRTFDGSSWVDSPGSRRFETDGGTTLFIEPGDLASVVGAGPVVETESGQILTLATDGLGYAVDDDVGRRYVRDWPTTWLSCSPRYPCGEGSATNDRGIEANHDDERQARFLTDTSTGRLARASDSSIWVLGGPTVEDLWSGRAVESGAIYRLDPAAPGFLCQGCY